MSRKGKKVITLENNVEVSKEKELIKVKGPKGELTLAMRDDFDISIKEDQLSVLNNSKLRDANSFHGLYRSLLANLVEGVSKGYEIQLELFGVGYRVQKQGESLQFSLGYSHPIQVDPVEGVTLDVEGQTDIFVRGIDKQKVGEAAANIIKLRDARKDPYKCKGVKFKGAVLRKKAGKKVK